MEENLKLYSFDYMHKNEILATVIVYKEHIEFKNFSKNSFDLPFGVKKVATKEDLRKFFESRCFPKERENAKKLLEELGLDHYDAKEICKITRGIQHDDFKWIRFDGDKSNYDSIKIRV